MMLMIVTVYPASSGEEMGLVAGDRVIAVNGEPIKDLVDWHYHIAGEEVEIEIERSEGERYIVEVEKDYEDDLGLSFACEPRSCANKCVFCFIDQQPQGLRDTLYVKDDDYRLSFLHGNYVTLTNISKKEKQRIIDQRLSPLYISIHTTDPEVRTRMLGRLKGGDVMDDLHLFSSSGIEIHGQIVLCPGYNDGPVLKKTFEDLLPLNQQLLSLAVVPVGLTRHRQDLPSIRGVDSQVALEVISLIDHYRQHFTKLSGRATLYAADEFYLQAGLPVPGPDYYEDFAQLENGIGLIRRTFMELEDIGKKRPVPAQNKSVLILTGLAAYDTIKSAADLLETSFPGLRVQAEAVENKFLGSGITVAGLLCGQDLLDHVKGRKTPDLLVLPGVAVRAGKFIDGVLLRDFETLTAVTAPETIQELYDYLKDW